MARIGITATSLRVQLAGIGVGSVNLENSHDKNRY